jgi:hypothetical protein
MVGNGLAIFVYQLEDLDANQIESFIVTEDGREAMSRLIRFVIVNRRWESRLGKTRIAGYF